MELIKKICSEVEDKYVIKKQISKITQYLTNRFSRYIDLKEDSLAKALTDDLREISNDLHFKVTYSRNPSGKSGNTEESPEETAEFHRIAKMNNFGCEKVERLSGNVGYWRISEFYDLIDGSGPTILAAMQFLQNTDALIVDIRSNTGGDPATVGLCCSFFFDIEPLLLNTLESRQGAKNQQFWTLPHLNCDRYLEKPVYIIVNDKTFSAAEEFAYNLKTRKRAVIIGNTTAGAAHLRESYRLDGHYSINIPVARPVNPITGTNWERVGVKPDIELDDVRCFSLAYYLSLRNIVENCGHADQRSEVSASIQSVVESSPWVQEFGNL